MTIEPVDPRISEYRRAAHAIVEGDFHPAIDLSPDDEVAELGRAILELGDYLDRASKEMDALQTVSIGANRGLLLEEILDHVYESFRKLVPYDRIGFALLSPDSSELTAHWARTTARELQITAGYSAPMAGSSLQLVMETGRPRIINDLEAYLAGKPGSESTRLIVDEGMRSSLTCPLVAPEGPVGFMFFSSTGRDTYRDVHVGIFEQIASQLAAVLHKSRLIEELMRVGRLKDRLLGTAAHDLRNPVAVVLGYAEVLREGGLGPLLVEQQEAIGYILDEAVHMRDILTDLLDVAAIEAGAVDLAPAAEDARTLLADRARAHSMLARSKSQTLEVEIPFTLPEVLCDAHRTRQILDNLLSNAMKYTNPGGSISLRAMQDGDEVRFDVVDTGQGISPDELPRIFEDFARTSATPTGGEPSTGLGLAIVRRLVEAQHGRVAAASTPGVGSTFSFWLPAVRPAESGTAAA